MSAAPKPEPRVVEVFDTLEELKEKKSNFEARAQMVGDLVSPSRNFQLAKGQADLRARHLRDPTGIMCNKRLAAFIYGDMTSEAQPWVMPKLLDRDPAAEEALWFEQAAVRMHARLSGPDSLIATQMFEGALDITGYGTNCFFKSRPRGQLPRVQCIPLGNTYFDENDEGQSDIVYREFTLKAWRAAKRYPNDPDIAKAVEQNRRQVLTFIHACDPRDGGVKGAIGRRKPWASDVVSVDFKKVIDDSQGFDSFPFQIARFERVDGDPWGNGPGWQASPAIWSANAMCESVLRQAELITDPPLFGNPAIFGGRLDRRPGAMNPINNSFAFYGQSVKDMIGRLDVTGDIGIGIEMLAQQRNLIQQIFFIDWLWMREGPQMTATEVNFRREMRMRMLAPIVARLTQEWLNPLVQDYFFAMLAGGFLGTPPASLSNEQIGFEYRSPLVLAQQGAMADAIEQTFETAAKAAAFDETAGLVLKADEMLGKAARLRGVPEKLLRGVDELEALRLQRAQERQEQMAMEAAQKAGSALQSGAQGLATLQQSDVAEAA